MSQEDVGVVRQPVAVRAQSRRRLEERLALRFPRALAFLARAFWRLPPRSRMRQAIIRRAVRLGTEAVNRGDYEAAFGLYHPDCEAIFPPQIVGLGEDPLHRGREGRIGIQRSWSADGGRCSSHLFRACRQVGWGLGGQTYLPAYGRPQTSLRGELSGVLTSPGSFRSVRLLVRRPDACLGADVYHGSSRCAMSEIRLLSGDVFTVEGTLDEVEKRLSDAARSGQARLAWFKERSSEGSVGINPAHVAALRASEGSD